MAGGSAWAADRYLIDHVEIDSASAFEASQGTASAATASTGGTVSGTTYTSDLATIDISTTVVGTGTDQVTYFVADVSLTDATALRSAFANDEFGTNIIEDTCDIAAEVNAVFAINGDYYGFRDTGIVIRNGTVFRDDGRPRGPRVLPRRHDEALRRDRDRRRPAGRGRCLEHAVVRAGAGRGRQVVDGIDRRRGRHQLRQPLHPGQQPRTAIGLVDANHLLFVVVDGRSHRLQPGVTMTELGQIFVDRGASTAYNLDGGGSSTMVFDGDLVNDPLGRGQERGTSDILYIGA